MPNNDFAMDLKGIRERARQHIEDGPVTDDYKGNLEVILKLLNEALATEIVCVLRYKRHQFSAKGINSKSVIAEFKEHAAEEQQHADLLAERISQLGGDPNFNPAGLLDRSHSQYVEGTNLIDMIKEDLVAERIAIDSYLEMVRYIGDKDPTTRRVLETILASEEEHANDLADLISSLDGASEKKK